MTVTSYALKKSRVTGVFISVLLFSGTTAYLAMPRQMDPGFVIRAAQVVTVFPGASPDRVEQLVTDPIEQAVQAISELDFVSSKSRTGVSVVSVNVREEFKDVRPIWDSLRRKIDAIKVNLPSGIQGPDINDDLGDTYPMFFSMTGDGFSDRELAEYAETIRDQLLHIDGVGKVEVIGDQDERIFVEYSNRRLSQLGLSPGQIKNDLQARNIIMPGGQVDIGDETLVLEPSGNFVSVEDLNRTLVRLSEGGLAYLGDIVNVRRGYVDPPTGLVRVNGRRAVTFAISMSEGNNLIELGQRIQDFFAGLPAYYPHGIDFELTYFQPKDVDQKVGDFVSSVLQAIAIVLVVMLLFLGFRTGLIVSSLIPCAMVIAMLILSVIGESINQMSLAALIIALGLLVDNAIVVSELVMVRMGQGESGFDAAVSACKELQTPLLVSSLTTAAAFLPIYLAESAVGEYTGALFTVVTITLLVSWGLALTLIPLLCASFLKVQPTASDTFDSKAYAIYRASLGFALKHRLASIVVVIATFAASLPLWGLVPQIFFPSEEVPFFMAGMNLPPGTNIEATMKMSDEIDHFIETELVEKHGVTSWTTFIGETPPPFQLGYTPAPSDGGYCELMVNTKDVALVHGAMQALHRFALGRFPNVQTDIRMLGAGPSAAKPVEVRISGPDTFKLFKIIDELSAEMEKSPAAYNIDNDWGPRVKKLKVAVDEARARRAGVTNQDVANAMRSFLTGNEATTYREDDETIPVVIRSVATGRRDLDRIRNLSIFTQQGRVSLSQVASVGLAWEPSAILRRDRYRTVTLEAAVTPGYTAMEVFTAVQPWLEEQQEKWGLSYRWEFGGDFESSVKANASIADKLPLAGLVILLLLVIQFNSMRKTTIVLSTIVLALIGVVVGLVVMRSSFGFMTLLGVVSLAGIVINNAIVLLDRIQIEIDEGEVTPAEAIVLAAQQRVRPILLTTATTVASLIPLYISGGEMWRPMAVAIMFGLVFSTVLTLVVVPILYAVMFRISTRRYGDS